MQAIIVDVAPNNLSREDLDIRLDEVENLVNTYGSLVVVRKVQKRETPDYATYVGQGKLEEILTLGEEMWVDLVVIGNILKPAQIYHINEYFRENKSKIQAWDRVDLILKIFQLHARSPEARLQVELASIKHMWPRIYGMGMELSNQWWGSSGGWSGMRWQWETNTEIMKRHLRHQELKIVEQLEKYEKTRAQHRQSRTRKGFKTIGIVGYTNAGKSSLMNVFTHKWVLAENKLFATLGTSVWKMYYENPEGKGTEVLVNDTIGFIRDLPPNLIKAFSSTLEDSIESDILIHVIDASDPRVADKIEVVEKILTQIGATQRRINVFNKIDLVSPDKILELKYAFAHLDPIFISAQEKGGIEELKEIIKTTLEI